MQHFLPLTKRVAMLLCFWLCSFTAWAQVSITTLNSAYTQDFNSLAISGTGTAVPAGWTFAESGTNANAIYTAGTGSGTAGDTYSFGSASATDRAFGGLLSGSLTPTIGAGFTNNTGSTITSLTIVYTGEQWRIGATSANRAVRDTLNFQFSTNATSLTTGIWQNADALDFVSPVAPGTTVGALDGNVTANRQTLSTTLTGLFIPVGATIWIRWTDANVASSDDGLAVDDFSLTANGEVTNPIPTLTVSSSIIGFGEIAANTTSVKSFTITGSNLTDNVKAVVTGLGYTISKDSITFDTLVSFTSAEVSTPKKIFVRFTPAAFGSFTGTIAINSTDALTQTVNLSGSSANPFEQNFNVCSATLPGGWSQYSVTGAQTWACTTFGRTGNAVQINGYSGGAVENEDWLISPALDLTGLTYPLLSFWSRTAFTGPTLKLLVSTNYSGTGNPSAAVWTELNGQFPLVNSDVWTQSSGINLVNFKQAGVYIAFVYTSSPALEAARWTIDDFSIINSTTPPSPLLSTSITPLTELYFESSVNVPSDARSFQVSVANATSDLTVSVPAPFQLSKDGNNFSGSVVYSVSELDFTNTVYIRALPATEGAFAGRIQLTTGSIHSTQGYATASSISKSKTFDVATMNVEWFGHPSNGPSNNALQAANLRTLINRLDVDIFTLQEISDTVLFVDSVANLLPGYKYVVSSYVSNPETNDPYAQKVITLYKTATVSKLSSKTLLTGVNVNTLPNYPGGDPTRFWASGRLPLLLDAQVTINGVSKHIVVVNIHARANSGDDISRYQMRAYDVKVLKDTLDAYYGNVALLLQGDYNDDVDSTVAPIPSPLISSYQPYVLDSTHYKTATRVLSDAGLRSYITQANVIDHITMTDELFSEHLSGSTRIDYALNYITNYENTLSDHLPSLTRFKFKSAPSVAVTAPAAGSVILKGTDLVVTATASDVDGSVTKVEFYNGTTLLGTDYSSPYSYTISQAATGTYTLTAIAYDDDNLKTQSASVQVKVVETGIQGSDCATPGQSYTYELFVDPASVSSISWWVNGSATIVKDPANARKVTINFTQYNSTSVQVYAGVSYKKSPWYTQFSKVVKVGGCTPADTTTYPTGISGTSCATPSQVYEFELQTNPTLSVSSVSWWVNGSATITVDPVNKKKVKVVFTKYNSSNVQLTAGVTYSSSPWYESFTKTIQIGGCSNSSRISDELSSELTIQAYPNPANDRLTVSFGRYAVGDVKVRILDILGKEYTLEKNIVSDNEVELNTKSLPSGVYVLQIISSQKTEVLRVVKQ
ncbi:Ig-like domain-containing protein [Cytophagaceae bacterium DM2B3-1]|uniref:Ig-like domain-containing protein n=1 Tax=Xanthocytophaga flava TaxID=3048013 RepID=A0ABT7CDA2_9BACT|nr:Ig-like domain-containing protein [Xanthocytophaga flavus]MDJ1491669.1 Ig-like domain-containing protein [Xanthocytophaga flavus]